MLLKTHVGSSHTFNTQTGTSAVLFPWTRDKAVLAYGLQTTLQGPVSGAELVDMA